MRKVLAMLKHGAVDQGERDENENQPISSKENQPMPEPSITDNSVEHQIHRNAELVVVVTRGLEFES